MDQKVTDTLSAVSDATVQEPITMSVDIKTKNWLHGKLQSWGILPKQRKFIINPITMGNLIRISKLLLDIDMNVFDLKNILESNYQAISLHAESLAKIVAICIHNKKSDAPEALKKFVLYNFTSKELMSVISIVINQMDLANFMKSIISVKGMNIMENPTANATIANENEVSP